jgi:gluconokinase
MSALAPPAPTTLPRHVVVMGVAGCGKSTLAAALAQHLDLPLRDADTFHSEYSRAKMRAGQALTDADRAPWLAALAASLQESPQVLACSALKRSYRAQLRVAAPALCFVHLALSPEAALARVRARPGHFFPEVLVRSQFETLEPPEGEPGVWTLDALMSTAEQLEQLRAAWSA